jgi:hypothetical protein
MSGKNGSGVGGTSVAVATAGGVSAGSGVSEPSGGDNTVKKITVDNAVRTLADKFFESIVAGLPEGRVLLAAEEGALKAGCVKKALAVKAKEEAIRQERHDIAGVLKDDIMDGLSFLNGNSSLQRYALDKIAQTTILHRVGERGTRTGDDVEALHLEDDLASMLGDIDIDSCLDEMTDLRDTRSRSLGGTKKAKSEDDPLFAQINEVVPTLRELLMSQGKEVALYCMKAIGKANDFSVVRMKAAE